MSETMRETAPSRPTCARCGERTATHRLHRVRNPSPLPICAACAQQVNIQQATTPLTRRTAVVEQTGSKGAPDNE